MVDIMIENLNKAFEEGGALAKVELHCLEQMTWTEKEIRGAFEHVWGMKRIEGARRWYGTENYKLGDRNSADAVFYISTYVDSVAGRGKMGGGLSKSLESFDNFYSWTHLGYITIDYVEHHELGHNLGNAHSEDFTYWTNFLLKRFRFALAAIGDEEEPCPSQEADWEFRSRCFRSFGQYTGGELENEGRTDTEKSAKECQARCAATEGCSSFSFKEVGAGCHMSSSAAELTFAKGVVGGPVNCTTGGSILVATDIIFLKSRGFQELTLSCRPITRFCILVTVQTGNPKRAQIPAKLAEAQLTATPAHSPLNIMGSPMSAAPLSTMTRYHNINIVNINLC